jgi:hypothetical protein
MIIEKPKPLRGEIMYNDGDWVVEVATGRIGYVLKKYWCEVRVKFGRKTEIVYPEMIELAPMDLQQEDFLDIELSRW